MRKVSSTMSENELRSISQHDSALSHNKIKQFLSKLDGDFKMESVEQMEQMMQNTGIPTLNAYKSVHASLLKDQKEEFATLHYGTNPETNEPNQFRIPILTGSDGKRCLDIQTLYAKTGHFCYDPGYTITGSCKSTIGNATPEGKLYYRGFDVE